MKLVKSKLPTFHIDKLRFSNDTVDDRETIVWVKTCFALRSVSTKKKINIKRNKFRYRLTFTRKETHV